MQVILKNVKILDLLDFVQNSNLNFKHKENWLNYFIKLKINFDQR